MLTATLVGLGVVGSKPARAGALRFDPIFVTIPLGQRATILTVTNSDTTPTVTQMRCFAWSQQGDTDPLQPTSDLIVSPPIATIAATDRQVVRLFLRRAIGETERYYRLLVEQIPPPPTGRAEISVALNASLPVIVDGTTPGTAELGWQILGMTGNQLTLLASNPGTHWLRLNRLEAALPDGRRILGRPAGENPYVLPGSERRWYLQLPAGSTRPDRLQISAKTSAGMKTTDLALSL